MKKILIALILGTVFLIACSPPETYQGNIEEVLALGGSYNCTAHKEGEYDLNILIKGTKLRGTANTPSGVIESVGDINNCVYGWYKEGGAGEVICVTEEELKEGISVLKKSKEDNITLDCVKYEISDEIFENKPKDIEFVSTIGPN